MEKLSVVVIFLISCVSLEMDVGPIYVAQDTWEASHLLKLVRNYRSFFWGGPIDKFLLVGLKYFRYAVSCSSDTGYQAIKHDRNCAGRALVGQVPNGYVKHFSCGHWRDIPVSWWESIIFTEGNEDLHCRSRHTKWERNTPSVKLGSTCVISLEKISI